MRSTYATQALSYPIRLPDRVQAEALRLLDVSREVINATVAALWERLRYKCHVTGVHLAWQHASGTTHTCPHCGKPAHTYADPALDAKKLDAGPWLRCFVCGWNGARDYAAAINIALLGIAYLKHALHSIPSPPDDRPTMTQKGLNSESYSGSGLALRLPPTSPRGRLIESGKLFVNGWVKSVTLHSALPPDHMRRLSG